MTREQFNEIQSQLKEWRETRNLTTESQRDGYIGNILEELTELARAADNYERADALCDMLVFTFNICENIQLPYTEEAGLDFFIPEGHNTPQVLLRELLHSFNQALLHEEDGNKFNHLKITSEFMSYLLRMLRTLQIDPYLAMQETIKEISSRTGYYDNILKKFIKDKGAYNRADAVYLNHIKSYTHFKETDTHWCFSDFSKESDCYKLKSKDLPELYWQHKIKKWYKADYSKCLIKE